MEVSQIVAQTLVRAHVFARVNRIKESFIKSMLHSRPLRTSATLKRRKCFHVCVVYCTGL